MTLTLTMHDGSSKEFRVEQFCRKPSDLRSLTKSKPATAADDEGAANFWWDGKVWRGAFHRHWSTCHESSFDNKADLVKWAEAHWGFMQGGEVPVKKRAPSMDQYKDCGREDLLDVIEKFQSGEVSA